MAAETFIAGLDLYQLLITVLIWVCVAINFFTGNKNAKINLVIVVIGYLAI